MAGFGCPPRRICTQEILERLRHFLLAPREVDESRFNRVLVRCLATQIHRMSSLIRCGRIEYDEDYIRPRSNIRGVERIAM